MTLIVERVDRKVRGVRRRDRAIQGLKVEISNHFAENASALWEARSGQVEDEERLRTTLDPGFEGLVGRIRHWSMPDTAIYKTVRGAVFQGNVDTNHISAEADVYAHAYLARLRDYRASISPQSRRSR